MKSFIKELSTQAATTGRSFKFAWLLSIIGSEIVIIGGTYLSLLELRNNEEARKRLHKYWPSALKRFYWAEDKLSGGLLTGEKLKLLDLKHWHDASSAEEDTVFISD